MLFAILNVEAARSAVRQTLALGPDCATADARFELVRATVWGVTAGGVPAHTAKVLNASLGPWRLLCSRLEPDDEELRNELRDALRALVDSGDLIEAGGGHWVAAVSRVVHLDHEAGRLLVGGVPLSYLPPDEIDIQHNGPYRRIRRMNRLATLLPVESQATWARIPNTPLQEWAGELLNSIVRVAYRPASEDSFEFYLPATAAPHAPQFKRWFASLADAKGTVLARRTRVFGAKEYRVVDVSAGHIVRVADLPGTEARRLMYALDSDARNPVRARCVPIQENLTEIVLTSELPRPEQRVMASFGTLNVPADRYWERRWTFERHQTLPQVLLTSLGVEITTASAGRAIR